MEMALGRHVKPSPLDQALDGRVRNYLGPRRQDIRSTHGMHGCCCVWMNQQRGRSRRSPWWIGAGNLEGVASSATIQASTDLGKGMSHWLDIGAQTYSKWLSGTLTTSISGGEGEAAFDSVTSASFVHGLLIGALVVVLITVDKLFRQGPSASQTSLNGRGLSEQGTGTGSSVSSEAMASLQQIVTRPEVSSMFHDPQVHDAIEELRKDPLAINRYRDNKVVMDAFQKLLEIEGLLERL